MKSLPFRAFLPRLGPPHSGAAFFGRLDIGESAELVTAPPAYSAVKGVSRGLFAGTDGSLSLPTMDLWSYPGQGGWYAPLARTEVTVVSFDPLVEQLRHFLAVIAGDEMPLISVGDAMRTLAVVEAVREAARTGGRISPSRTVEQAE
jgi:predicted dehydrogenase